MQYALPDIDLMSIDLDGLQVKRDRMVTALREYGYELRVPEATFYLLVKAPIEDDVAFTRRLRAHKVLVLPGRSPAAPWRTGTPTTSGSRAPSRSHTACGRRRSSRGRA
jgi:aspartate aminotransferase